MILNLLDIAIISRCSFRRELESIGRLQSRLITGNLEQHYMGPHPHGDVFRQNNVSADESSLDEIESGTITLGLGALPTVIDRHNAAATKELRSRFDRLLRKLNDIVMDVLLSDQSQRISEKAIVLKGKPLDIVKCEQIARAILQENSAAQGIYLNAVRESSGVEIYIELLDTERTRREIKSRKQVKGSGSNGYDRLSITNRLGTTEFNSPQPKSAIRKLLTDSGLMPIETWFSLTLEIYNQPQ